MVVMALCAVLSGADDFVSIARWAELKKDWLAKFLDMSAGVPSHDRFNAVLGALKPAEFEKCLLSWITAVHEITDGQVIAIDGKALRRSFDAASRKAAIHMVSAWATANRVSLGQVVTDEKSNEITPIPKLLEILEIKGCLVTIDAMGCQRDIAEQIVAAEADYVLAVKDNQPKLCQAIREFFSEQLEDDCRSVACRRYESHEKGHGREDDRYYYLAKLPEDFPLDEPWPHLKAIGIAVRVTRTKDGKETSDVRYYGASRYLERREVRRGSARPMGNRKRASLATRRDVRQGSVPPSQRPRRRQLQPVATSGSRPLEKQRHREGRREKQAPLRRVERRLPTTSPLRQVNYDAIALAVG
jgi:predicted transposase YbfD/YdcC